MRARRVTTVATTLVASLALAACSSTASGTDGAASGEAGYPITIEHALGTTTIDAKPTSVAAVGWANQDTALALGVSPVGFGAQTWGVEDGSGMMPWTKEKVEELGGDPVLFDETDGIDYEALANTAPDVILAAYSGITEEEYGTLSDIADTVAYPETAWATTWRDQIKYNSEAMGLATEGEALTTELETLLDEKVAEYPQIDGKTGAFMYAGLGDESQIGFYTSLDPRAGYLEDLGLSVPQSVADATETADGFYVDISAENIDQLNDVDVLVVYGDQALLDEWQADPLISQIPAVQNGSVVLLGNDGALAASANPSPLSIPWGVDEYVQLIADAADKVK
ncbi:MULTISPECIES: iron-siderophore ABC transporter substrate-binding protein [Gulosibacter]|uniref:iron-siderophore ABC transporter substrate-binding protein n=1 Tax=Gulosibacter TaxID=256818 RepID=UPI000F641AD6|nr:MULTISPECIES: iron-siderophore ABC transporter substrate-binding protein [Gulosibacter]